MAVAPPHFFYTTMPPPPSTAVSPTQDDLKRMAAHRAVDYVKSGMVLGLGTGSTAVHAIRRIGDLLRRGDLSGIVGIPTSKQTEEQATEAGIPLSDLESHPSVDLAIDGADEVDPHMNLVKGRGGSLLREKMIEGTCERFVVIVDESKLVDYIGGSRLAMPVEVIPFCCNYTLERLRWLFVDSGCTAELRIEKGKPFETDNGNYIVNLYFERDIGDLNDASDRILRLPGVVEHGMFLGMATTLIVAGKLGLTVKEKSELAS